MCRDKKISVRHTAFAHVTFVLAVTALIFVSSCAPVTRGPQVDHALATEEAERQRQFAIKEHARLEKRLKRVAWNIQKSATFSCEDYIKNRAGLNLVTQGQIDKPLRPAYKTVFRISEDRPTVLYPFPGSPAEKAGFKTGDIITKVNGASVPRSRDGIKAVMHAIETSKKPLSLEIQRNSSKKTLSLAPQSVCSYPVRLVNDQIINAFADGKNIIITAGMMRFVESDDELALVVGHELAHNTMEHIQKKQTNVIAGQIVGTVLDIYLGETGIFSELGQSLGAGLHSQDFESEADYIGVYYAAAAGYNVKDAAHLWRRMAAANPEAIHLKGSTHPSTAKRFLAIGKAADEVADKIAKGLPIIPSLNQKTPEDKES